MIMNSANPIVVAILILRRQGEKHSGIDWAVFRMEYNFLETVYRDRPEQTKRDQRRART